MVKLNIEMSMASLVVRLAQGKTENDVYEIHSTSRNQDNQHHQPQLRSGKFAPDNTQSMQLSSTVRNGSKEQDHMDVEHKLGGIHCRTDLHVVSEEIGKSYPDGAERASSRSSVEAGNSAFGDDIPLQKSLTKLSA
jgi:hypothetical protein